MHGRLFDLNWVCPDPLRPAMLTGPPKVDAHQGAAHSACLLFGSYGCHPRFQSRQCSSAGCAFNRWHRARSTCAEDTASRRGYARAASHGPKAPDRAGHCDAASRLGLFQRHRWRLRVREEPSVLLLDSSGAIGGVLELPGDDYFISTAAEGRAGCIPARSNRFVSAYRAPHVVFDKQRQYHIKRTVKGRII